MEHERFECLKKTCRCGAHGNGPTDTAGGLAANRGFAGAAVDATDSQPENEEEAQKNQAKEHHASVAAENISSDSVENMEQEASMSMKESPIARCVETT